MKFQITYVEFDFDGEDEMTADDYESKAYQSDGWEESKYDRQYW